MSKVAFLFPGQGAQAVGMADSLIGHPSMKRAFDLASDHLGTDLYALSKDGSEAQLKETKNAQLLMYTYSAGLVDILRECGWEPDAVAGLSLGEYTALYAAGYFTFEQGLEIVLNRGIIMDRETPPTLGGMVTALGLTDDQLEAESSAIRKNGGNLWLSNFNCPGQIVLSGDFESIDQFKDRAEELGAKKVIQLQVQGPFHSPLMARSAEGFRTYLETTTFSTPNLPLVTNTTGTFLEGNLVDNYASHITSPVLWAQSITHLIAQGFDTFVEVGAGKTLSGFMRRIDRKKTSIAINDNTSLESAIENWRNHEQ